ncbi:hypothetical protein HY448_02620 [Candidatus Pacearchaeota archaeon]|nr:hypothetical protein [Candidatus Pacearchaeota archaeon]
MDDFYKGYCVNMDRRSLPSEKGVNLSPQGYYCNLTNDLCVASRRTFFDLVSHRVNIGILKRCPSRRTVDDIVKEKPLKLVG